MVNKYGFMCHHIVRCASNVFDTPPFTDVESMVSLLLSGAKKGICAPLSDKINFI